MLLIYRDRYVELITSQSYKDYPDALFTSQQSTVSLFDFLQTGIGQMNKSMLLHIVACGKRERDKGECGARVAGADLGAYSRTRTMHAVQVYRRPTVDNKQP